MAGPIRVSAQRQDDGGRTLSPGGPRSSGDGSEYHGSCSLYRDMERRQEDLSAGGKTGPVRVRRSPRGYLRLLRGKASWQGLAKDTPLAAFPSGDFNNDA